MTPEQCRMARAGLSIGARELAEAARVSVSTVTRFEAGQVVHEMTLALIQTALERYGIEFVADSSGVGAWLRKPSKSIIPAANLNAENIGREADKRE
jgi:transcriptional regulator with XRE-family HTH domain